jgi:UDP-GlcNAc:undecaprenyl-phosphate GlcNAc-1-phosphate transferase
MLNLGHSHGRAVALLWLWSALVAYGVVLIGLFPNAVTVMVFLVGILLAAFLTWGRRVVRPANG